MKVYLAAQIFSKSVANALKLLMDTGHPDFADAEATIEFILIIDRYIKMAFGLLLNFVKNLQTVTQ